MLQRLIALALLTPILWASESHGNVQFSGLPLPGATVIATQGESKFQTVTNEDGAYSFKDLPDGSWTQRVEMLGFTPSEQTHTVGPDAPPFLFDMKMLSVDALKAIAPAAAPPAAVPPVTTGVSVTTSNKKNAPKNAAPQPATTFRRTEAQAAAPKGSAPEPPPASADAAPAPADASDSLAINGSANNGAASAFATSPAFGNNRRGAGSLYNGNLGLVLGNSALDARPFSITGQDTPKAAYNHLQASASVGGPVRIPHLFMGNNPVNFFVAYQLARNRNANTISTLVPTSDQRNGIVSPTLTVPTSSISPQAAALLRFYPLPNFTSSRFNYQTALRSIANTDSLQTRLSKSIGRSNQLSAAVNYQNSRGNSTSLFAFTDADEGSGLDATVTWTRRFSQRLFSTTKYQFTRNNTRSTPFFSGRENVSGETGITGNNQDPLNYGPPTLFFSAGIAALTDGLQSYNRFQTQSIGTSIFFAHSPHNFTFGGDYKRQQYNYLGQQNARGTFAFTGAATGSDFADFLTGTPDTSSIAFGNADKYFRANVYDLFLSDDWRVSPSLTLNVGVRWDYSSPISEKYARLVNLNVTAGFRNATPVIGNNTLNPSRNAFQPRIGVSWRPIAGSSLVVRSGYGITEDTSVYQSIATRMAQQAPLSTSLNVQNTAANPLTLARGFIASPGVTATTFAVDPHFRPGYAQSWNLQIQRDLPASLVMMATYLGIKGTHAQQVFLPNTYPSGALNPCPSCDTGYIYLSSNGNSSRHSAQLQLRRRLRSGLTATLIYTWAKALDNGALGGRGQGGQLIAQNWLDLSAERGLSPFDQRQVLNFQVQYTSGFGVHENRFLRDWTFATQIVAATGFPLSPVVIAAAGATGITGTIRPDYTGADLYNAPNGLFLNPAAYRVAASGQWGNAGRNSIEGPGQFSLNSSMARTFRLHGRYNADLRFDSTNTLNHVTYPNWNTVVNSAQFGLPNQANPMRNVTANLRIRF